MTNVAIGRRRKKKHEWKIKLEFTIYNLQILQQIIIYWITSRC